MPPAPRRRALPVHRTDRYHSKLECTDPSIGRRFLALTPGKITRFRPAARHGPQRSRSPQSPPTTDEHSSMLVDRSLFMVTSYHDPDRRFFTKKTLPMGPDSYYLVRVRRIQSWRALFTSLAQAAPEATAEPAQGGPFRGTTEPSRGELARFCKRCEIPLSPLLSEHQGPLCPACITVCVARVLSDWERSRCASRVLVERLRRRSSRRVNRLRRSRALTTDAHKKST
jgi:hypothetical protein